MNQTLHTLVNALNIPYNHRCNTRFDQNANAHPFLKLYLLHHCLRVVFITNHIQHLRILYSDPLELTEFTWQSQ
jgi:hypothetical protein